MLPVLRSRTRWAFRSINIARISRLVCPAGGDAVFNQLPFDEAIEVLACLDRVVDVRRVCHFRGWWLGKGRKTSSAMTVRS